MLTAFVLCTFGVTSVGASGADLARLDQLYARRDEPQVLGQLGRAVGDLLRASGEDSDLLWRAARAHCAMAEASVAGAARQAEAELCWNLGDRARSANPTCAAAHYWAATGVGLWAQSVGMVRAAAAGIEAKFNERLDKAIALDPTTDRGGPWLIKGRFFQDSPWPIRDLKRAGEYYERALARFPESLKARLFYATWLAEQGEGSKARAELEAVLAGDTSYDPPAARAAKTEAARRLESLGGFAR